MLASSVFQCLVRCCGRHRLPMQSRTETNVLSALAHKSVYTGQRHTRQGCGKLALAKQTWLLFSLYLNEQKVHVAARPPRGTPPLAGHPSQP